MNRPAIKEVINRHAGEIMSIPGVTGIYEGRTKNDKPCIKIMVEKKSKEIRKKIPTVLEGYPVLIEVSGTIKPMNNDTAKSH